MIDAFRSGTVRRSLPVREWPAPDRVAWAAAHHRGGLLDDDGRAASWAPASSKFFANGYGRFLSFLIETEALDTTALPENRITRARVETYVAYLVERNHSSTVATRVSQLARVMAVIAPAADWAWLRYIAARLRQTALPARDDRVRMVPATVVCDLGIALMQRAEATSKLSEYRRALLFRNGLLICILCACPLRARNIAAMSIGTTFQRRGDEWWVTFGPSETKNGRPFEVPVPAAYTGAIERYLAHYRAKLVQRSRVPLGRNAFWISYRGCPCTAHEIGNRIRIVTKRELGRGLNPHLFRKLVPTELAIRDPEHVGVAQLLLGHADYRTTQRAYNLGRALDAARLHHVVIQSIRAKSVAAPRDIRRAPVGKQSTDRTRNDSPMPRRSFQQG